MAIFRIEKNRDYTVMSNHHLGNAELPLKSKGLLSMTLSLPDGWNYTTKGLAKICKEDTNSIGSTSKEPERVGYIVRNRLRDRKSKIVDVEYVICEPPSPGHRLAVEDALDTIGTFMVILLQAGYAQTANNDRSNKPLYPCCIRFYNNTKNCFIQ